jgi:hypothetical protein
MKTAQVSFALFRQLSIASSSARSAVARVLTHAYPPPRRDGERRARGGVQVAVESLATLAFNCRRLNVGNGEGKRSCRESASACPNPKFGATSGTSTSASRSNEPSRFSVHSMCDYTQRWRSRRRESWRSPENRPKQLDSVPIHKTQKWPVQEILQVYFVCLHHFLQNIGPDRLTVLVP